MRGWGEEASLCARPARPGSADLSGCEHARREQGVGADFPMNRFLFELRRVLRAVEIRGRGGSGFCKDPKNKAYERKRRASSSQKVQDKQVKADMRQTRKSFSQRKNKQKERRKYTNLISGAYIVRRV